MANRNNSTDLRRSQLITPFGVGALNVREDGTSVITCGLDFWLNGIGETERVALDIDDSRLKERLKVGKLFRPPSVSELTESEKWNQQTNTVHPIPVLRFPTWFSCKLCGRLDNKQPHFRGIVFCPTEHGAAQEKKYQVQMFQVPYVAICDRGHLEDFPWNEWVHKSVNPGCDGPIYLREAQAGNLQNSVVSCATCGERRTMDMAMTTGANNRSNLTMLLDKNPGIEFSCSGLKPWLGSIPGENDSCNHDLYGSFRGASNVYFPFIESSILIPEGSRHLDTLVERLRGSDFVYARQLAKEDMEQAVQQILKTVAILCEEMGTVDWLSTEYTKADIADALQSINNRVGEIAKAIESGEQNDTEVTRNNFLKAEYLRLQQNSNDSRLNVSRATGPYGQEAMRIFSDIRLVSTLTETRAFWGFARLDTSNKRSFKDSREMLRRYKTKFGSSHDWLPAIQIKGEGIFFNFSNEKLDHWESNSHVKARMNRIALQDDMVDSSAVDVSPRFVLMHTISHLVIKELTYFCGYSQASLRERLYVSTAPNNLMSGFLVYTASGDSEGTLGGLVRMGKPGYLEEVISRAIEKSLWCSNDPVCMESGNSERAVGDATTLASCYACTLLPETSCEHFNKFLDRGFFTGSGGELPIAFFESK